MINNQYKILNHDWYSVKNNILKFDVLVISNSKVNKILGLRSNKLVIKVSSLPISGSANKALIKFIASEFNIRIKNIKILFGFKNRQKVVQINMDNENIDNLLNRIK